MGLKHCEKRLPLKWHSFRERSNIWFWFQDLRIRFWGLKIKHLRAHNFISLLFRNFDDQLSSNFHRFIIFCICWDTPRGKTGLWQLPILSLKTNWRSLSPSQRCGLKEGKKKLSCRKPQQLYLALTMINFRGI